MLTVGVGNPNQRISGDDSWRYVDLAANKLYKQIRYPSGQNWKEETEPFFVDLTNIPTDAEIAYWNAGGGSPVTSVFGRTGAVIAQPGDYDFSQLSGLLSDTQDYNTTVIAGPGYNTFTVDAHGRITAASTIAYLSSLTNAHIYVGNISNVPIDVAVSGDLSLINTGAFTVTKIQGNPIGGSATSGYVYIGQGGAWVATPFAGDITLTNLGIVTIQANVVSYSKIQSVQAVKLLGNPTGSTANVSEITLGSGLSFVGTTLTATYSYTPPVTTKGDVFTYSTVPTRIGIGANATIFMADSSATTGNKWVAFSGDATLGVSGALTFSTVNTTTGSYGSATQVATFTVNGKGLVTVSGQTSIQITESQVTNLTTDLAAKLSATLTNTHIFVGNVSNAATDVAVSGDLTLANTGAFTIVNNAVTYAKFQQVAASSLVGNATSSLANATGITLGATLTFVGSALQTLAHTGDVTSSGNSYVMTVAKINGVTLGTTTATNKNFLVADGTAWQSVAMSGDVTITANTGTTAIGSNKVTLAMMAQMATQSFLGRNTASTGNVEVLSASTTKTILSLNNVENTALSTWAGTTNITTLGTITTGTWNGTIVTLAKGGTGAALTASNGGIFYSTGTVGALLAGTATAGLALVSGASTTPTWFAPTAGSVIFAGTGGVLSQSNAKFFFTTTNSGGLGIGTSSPRTYGAYGVLSLDGSTGGVISFGSPSGTEVFEIVGETVGGLSLYSAGTGSYKFNMNYTTGNISINNARIDAGFTLYVNGTFKTTSTVTLSNYTTNGGLLYTDGSGLLSQSSNLTFISNALSILSADMKIATVGKGIYIKEGTNATMGTGTLVGGAATIATTKITANSRIFITDLGSAGTITNVGSLAVTLVTAGTSFVVTSTNPLDTSNFNWIIIEPA